MKTVAWAALLAASLILLAETAAAAETCPVADGPVRCRTCTNPEFEHVNVMTTLPRLSYSAGSVSSNLGQYEIFTCPDATNPDTPCEISTSLSGLDASQATNPPAGSILLYGHGVGGYVAVAIICGVLLPILAVCFCICRCHLTCMLCGASGGCFCCGYGVPSRKRPDACCGCGFVEVEDPLGRDSIGVLQENPAASDEVKTTPSAAVVGAGAADGSISKGPRFHYTSCSRWTPRVCLILNVACIVAFSVLQYTYGSAGITGAMKLFADSADAIVPIGNGLHTSMTSLAVDVGSEVLGPFIIDTNDTIHRAGSPKVLIDSIGCIVDGIGEAKSAFGTVSGNLTLVQNTLTNISSQMDVVDTSISGVNASIEAIAVLDQGILKADLTALGAVKERTPYVTGNASEALTSVQLSLNNFTSPTTGLPAVSERLAWYNNRPTTAEATAVAADMDSFNSGAFEGQANDGPRALAVARMETLATKASNLTGVPSLVALIRGLNADLDTFTTQNKTGAVIDAIHDTNALVAMVPNITRTLEAVTSTVGTVNTLLAELESVKTAVRGLETTVGSVDLGFIDTIDSVFTTAEKIIACAQQMQPEIDGFDRDLFKVPSVITSISSQIDTVNDTLTSARSTVNASQQQKAVFEDTLRSFNFSTYIASIDSAGNVSTSSFSAVTSEASSIDGSFGTVNFTSLLASISSVEQSLSDPSLRVNETTLNELTAISPVFSNLSTASQTALAAVVLYDTKRCSNTGSPCATAATCGGGGATCEGGLGRCINADGSGIGAGTIACVVDSGCPGSQVCSRDGVVFQVSKAVFEGYASTSTPDLTGTAASVSSFSDSVTGVTAIESSNQSIAEVNAAVEPLTLDSAQATAQIDSAAASARDVRPTIRSITGVIASVRDTLSLRDQIDSANSAIESASSGLDSASSSVDTIANGGMAALRSFERFWYTELGTLLRVDLSRASLQAEADAGGLGGVVVSIATVLDRVVAAAADAASAVAPDSASSLAVNLTSTVRDYVPAMNSLGDASVQAKGGIHYALTVGSSVTNASGTAALPITAVDGDGGTVFASASGVAYTDGQVCVTSSCLDKTITNLNQDNADVALSSFSSLTGDVSIGTGIPINRELGLVLPVTLPLLVALFGLLPVLCCCKCGLQPCCTRCLTCWNQFFSCCCASCLFIFFGALLFPLVMVTADACRSAPNVGFVYVEQSEAFICDALTGTLTSPKQCSVQVSSGVDVSVNIPRLYSALLGEDGCNDVESAEVVNTFTALSSVVDKLLEDGVNGTVVTAASSAGFDLRAPMVATILRASRSVGNATFNLLTSLGTESLSCQNINGAISGIYEGVCCGMTNPMYWFVSTYYLMAFSLCICGWGGSMLGYKRLPNELWGPHYEEALALPQNRRQERMQQRANQRAGMRSEAEAALGSRSAKVTPVVTSATVAAVDGEQFTFATPIGGGTGEAQPTLMKKKNKSNDRPTHAPAAAEARPSRGGKAL